MKLLKTIGTLALIGVAGLGGYLTKSNEVNGYSLQQQGQQTILYSEEIGKGYQLTQMNNESYMGDAEHNYQGVRALTNMELVFGNIPFTGEFQPTQSRLENLTENLTNKIKDLI